MLSSANFYCSTVCMTDILCDSRQTNFFYTKEYFTSIIFIGIYFDMKRLFKNLGSSTMYIYP